jgi:threonine dehydratase
VPIGGGSGAAGACLVAGTLGIPAEVIGVQSAAAPAAYRSWAAKELIADKMGTFAEGLATRTPFELPQRILWQCLDDFVLVEERELREATYRMIELTRNLVEPAGAAALAGALRLRSRLAGRRVGLIASGGNISPDQLREVLAAGTPDGHARSAAS